MYVKLGVVATADNNKAATFAETMAPLTRNGSARQAARTAPTRKKRVRLNRPKIAELSVEKREKIRQQNRDATARCMAKRGEEAKVLQRERAHNAYVMNTVIVSKVVFCRNIANTHARFSRSSMSAFQVVSPALSACLLLCLIILFVKAKSKWLVDRWYSCMEE